MVRKFVVPEQRYLTQFPWSSFPPFIARFIRFLGFSFLFNSFVVMNNVMAYMSNYRTYFWPFHKKYGHMVGMDGVVGSWHWSISQFNAGHYRTDMGLDLDLISCLHELGLGFGFGNCPERWPGRLELYFPPQISSRIISWPNTRVLILSTQVYVYVRASTSFTVGC